MVTWSLILDRVKGDCWALAEIYTLLIAILINNLVAEFFYNAIAGVRTDVLHRYQSFGLQAHESQSRNVPSNSRSRLGCCGCCCASVKRSATDRSRLGVKTNVVVVVVVI